MEDGGTTKIFYQQLEKELMSKRLAHGQDGGTSKWYNWWN
jgi:hypothetical protein